jgi:hypothetical protein
MDVPSRARRVWLAGTVVIFSAGADHPKPVDGRLLDSLGQQFEFLGAAASSSSMTRQ